MTAPQTDTSRYGNYPLALLVVAGVLAADGSLPVGYTQGDADHAFAALKTQIENGDYRLVTFGAGHVPTAAPLSDSLKVTVLEARLASLTAHQSLAQGLVALASNDDVAGNEDPVVVGFFHEKLPDVYPAPVDRRAPIDEQPVKLAIAEATGALPETDRRVADVPAPAAAPHETFVGPLTTQHTEASATGPASDIPVQQHVDRLHTLIDQAESELASPFHWLAKEMRLILHSLGGHKAA